MTGKALAFKPRPPLTASPVFHVGFEMEMSEEHSLQKIHDHAQELKALGAEVEELTGFSTIEGKPNPPVTYIHFNADRTAPLDREKFERFLSRLFEIIPADHVREANFLFSGEVDKQTAENINRGIICELDKGKRVSFDETGTFIQKKLLGGIPTYLSAAEIDYTSVHSKLSAADIDYIPGPGHYEVVGSCTAVDKSGFGLTPTAKSMTAKIMDGLDAINELHRTLMTDIMRTGRRTEAFR